MPEKIYCYCCRVHHEGSVMRLFRTRTGLRWRCRDSIAAAAAGVGERDAAGRRQTEWNREEARRLGAQANLARGEYGL